MTSPRISLSRRPLAVALVVGGLVVAGALLAYALVLRGDEVAPLALPSAAASQAAGGGSGAGTGTNGAPSLPPVTAESAADAGTLAGSWSVADGSVVGYRVREKLADLPAQSDAVGRTNAVTGSATLAATGGDLAVTAGAFTADVTTLSSDRAMRDGRIHTMGLESDTYPKATFTLTAPVEVPAAAKTGVPVDLTLHGDLTVHGVTRTVDIPVKAQLDGAQVEITGAVTFPFAEFGMTPPSVGSFVSVGNDATLEFLIALLKG